MESLANMIGSWLVNFHWRSWSWSNFNILSPFKFSWKKFWFWLIFFRLHQIWISFRRNFLNLREILIIRSIAIFSYIFSKFYSFIIVNFFVTLWKFFCHFENFFVNFFVTLWKFFCHFVKIFLSLCENFFVIPCNIKYIYNRSKDVSEYSILNIMESTDWFNYAFTEIFNSYMLSPDEFQFWWTVLRSKRTRVKITSIFLVFCLLSQCLTVLSLCSECPELKSVELGYLWWDVENEFEVVEKAKRRFKQKFWYIQKLNILKI